MVIPSHNYARYLPVSIESALSQTHRPREVIVVDDSSTDNTCEIVSQYAAQGVRYLRCEHGNALLARREGFLASESDIIQFLDADDFLPQNHLDDGLPHFTDNVGVVYSDLQEFGDSNKLRRYPDVFDYHRFKRANFVSANALVRRQALELTDGWTPPRVAGGPEDYWLWQRIAADGWQFRKQQSPTWYRIHAEGQHFRTAPQRTELGYANAHGLTSQDLTLFLPLSGRHHCWQQQRDWLDRQTWPHDLTRLILCDTSQSSEFCNEVRSWLWSCDYRDVRHVQLAVELPGLADVNRRLPCVGSRVTNACSRIYNRMRMMVDTDLVWIVEDDIIPPLDVAERLLQAFDARVASVAAPYLSRYTGLPVVWDRDPAPGLNHHSTLLHSGVTDVRGNGFGCVILRREVLQDHVFCGDQSQPWFDPRFYSLLGNEWIRRVDWSCRCEHLKET